MSLIWIRAKEELVFEVGLRLELLKGHENLKRTFLSFLLYSCQHFISLVLILATASSFSLCWFSSSSTLALASCLSLSRIVCQCGMGNAGSTFGSHLKVLILIENVRQTSDVQRYEHQFLLQTWLIQTITCSCHVSWVWLLYSQIVWVKILWIFS